MWGFLKEKFMWLSPLTKTRQLKEDLRQLDIVMAQSEAATLRSVQTSNAVKQVAERLQERYHTGSRKKGLDQ